MIVNRLQLPNVVMVTSVREPPLESLNVNGLKESGGIIDACKIEIFKKDVEFRVDCGCQIVKTKVHGHQSATVTGIARRTIVATVRDAAGSACVTEWDEVTDGTVPKGGLAAGCNDSHCIAAVDL